MHHGGSSDAATSTYSGVDRRRSRHGQRAPGTATDLWVFAAALIIAGLAFPTVLSQLPSPQVAIHAQSALRTTWAVLFVSAGALRMVRWRLTGETQAALLGSALFCFGLLSATGAAVSALITDAPRDVLLAPLTRSVATVACLVLLARAFRTPPVDTRVRPAPLTARALLLSVLALTVFITLAHAGHPVSFTDPVWLAIDCAFAACWLGLAGHAAKRGIRGSNVSLVWVSVGLLLLAGAELLNALAFVGPQSAVYYATGLRLIVGGLALVNAVRDLALVFSDEGNAMLSLQGALRETERHITEEERLQEERLHDARSVICALKAASLTLDRYDERLDTTVKRRLRSSLVSELGRLERVLDGRRKEPLEVFRLDVALMPLFIAERENGLTINNQLGSIKAKGRPVELATVVQNLLVNARHYAPGSTIRVRATSNGDRVQIFVEDRGGGVSPTEQELIFERGFRASNSEGRPGSGLGLYLARRLMREQAGEIVYRERDGGGACFVLSMLSSSADEPGRDAVQDDPAGHLVIDLVTDDEADRRRPIAGRRHLRAT